MGLQDCRLLSPRDFRIGAVYFRFCSRAEARPFRLLLLPSVIPQQSSSGKRDFRIASSIARQPREYHKCTTGICSGSLRSREKVFGSNGLLSRLIHRPLRTTSDTSYLTFGGVWLTAIFALARFTPRHPDPYQTLSFHHHFFCHHFDCSSSSLPPTSHLSPPTPIRSQAFDIGWTSVTSVGSAEKLGDIFAHATEAQLELITPSHTRCWPHPVNHLTHHG